MLLIKKTLIGSRNVFFILMIFCFSCSRGENNSDYGMVKIDLDLSKASRLSDFFQEPEFTLLDCNDTMPLVFPYKFQFRNGKIYVVDISLNNVLVFDNRGNFLKAYTSTGKGPKEFFQIDGFQVDDKEMMIQDTYLSKNLTLNFKGNVVNERENIFNNTSFYYGGKYMLYFLDYNPEFENHNFIRKDLESHQHEMFVEIPRNMENLTKYNKRNDFVIEDKAQKLYYTIPHSTDLAIFNKSDGRLDSLLHFDFGPYNMNNKYRSLGRKERNRIIEEEKYVELLDMFSVYSDRILLYVKQGGAKHHLIFLNKEYEVMDQIVNPINDFNDIKLVFPWTYDENSIFYLKNSIDIYNEYVQAYSGKKVNIKEGNIHDFFSKNKEKLKEEGWVLVRLELKL